MALTAYRDATSKNDITRNAHQYSDLDLFFTRKTSTSDVNKLTDVLAVKRSVRNLVLLNHYEKPFHPEIGSGIREMLFENMTPITAILIAKKVEDMINNYEPRAELAGVIATPDLDNNSYKLNIEFYIVNVPSELQTVDILLERLRKWLITKND